MYHTLTSDVLDMWEFVCKEIKMSSRHYTTLATNVSLYHDILGDAHFLLSNACL